MSFAWEYKPNSSSSAEALWFAYCHGKLLVTVNGQTYGIPNKADLAGLNVAPSWQHYIGRLDGKPCYAVEWPQEISQVNGFDLMGLRALFGLIDEELIWVAGRANQMVHWHQTHRFCGSCGHPTQDKADERAKICPQCGLINYPRVSPAVIMAVIRGDRILLGRSPRFPLPFYSVLAGFVEPGETLEDCVRREILEEVGITVKNIRYFGSQPWPFPNSLMVAFTAEYGGGEIRLNASELTDAGWFAANDLPELPSPLSIARRLIEWFRETHLPPTSPMP
jgi:NAD+ diphosphatase